MQKESPRPRQKARPEEKLQINVSLKLSEAALRGIDESAEAEKRTRETFLAMIIEGLFEYRGTRANE